MIGCGTTKICLLEPKQKRLTEQKLSTPREAFPLWRNLINLWVFTRSLDMFVHHQLSCNSISIAINAITYLCIIAELCYWCHISLHYYMGFLHYGPSWGEGGLFRGQNSWMRGASFTGSGREKADLIGGFPW